MKSSVQSTLLILQKLEARDLLYVKFLSTVYLVEEWDKALLSLNDCPLQNG